MKPIHLDFNLYIPFECETAVVGKWLAGNECRTIFGMIDRLNEALGLQGDKKIKFCGFSYMSEETASETK